MIGCTKNSLLAAAVLYAAVATENQATGQEFEKMAQPEELSEGCAVPRPPKELHAFAYVRNGYREILRILAAERALEEKDCGCLFSNVGWEEVVRRSVEFTTSDDEMLPFDVIGLRLQADSIEADLSKVCTK